MMLHREYGVALVVGTPLVLITAPLLVELLLVTLAAMLPRSRKALPAPTRPPLGKLVVVVPSHNEEASIARCVHSIAASAGGPGDILVVAHNCSDGTAAEARAAGAMVAVLNDPALAGKGNALAHGFHIAFAELGADAVIIIDADSAVAADLIGLVRQRLENASVLQCRYECRSATNDPRSRLRALAFFCMNVVRPLGRQRLHLSCGIFGNGFAMRRQVLEQVPYNAHSIVEDLEFHLCLIKAGIRCEFLEEARIWAEVPPNAAAAVTQSARWEGGRLRMFQHHAPGLFLQVRRGRLALLEPLVDLAGLPLALEVAALCGLLFFPAPVLRVYAEAGLGIILLHLAVALCLGPDPIAALRALLQAPFYVVSKVAMLPAIIRKARNRAAWVRTSRVEK
jgi:cellulose synthase/poly-beta-1,6-N-acetylglucosamine synthase-like glycosyltransferase